MSDFNDSDGFDDFEARARAAGVGLGGVAPASVDPAAPRRRLRRRRVVAASAAVVLVAGVGGGVALARDTGGTTKVDVATPDEDPTTTIAPGATTTTASGDATTTTAPPTTTTGPATTTIAPPTTTGPGEYPSPFPMGFSGTVSVQNGLVASVGSIGKEALTNVPGARIAYRLHAGLVVGTDSSVVVQAFGQTHTIPDVTLVGAGVYRGHSVAFVLDLHPDVLHDDWKFIRIYDLANGQLTGTQLSIAPGTTLDRVSNAGELFVMSGKSDEGGPFVLYRHVDGSFDPSLPDVIANQPDLDHGTVSDAVIAPDGKTIAYLKDEKVACVALVSTGERIYAMGVTVYDGRKIADGLDYDGHWAVATDSQDGKPALVMTTGNTEHEYGPLELDGALGPSTIDRG